MSIENNPKQIPDITLITTPTAGQETDIETVVAKHSTYATARMTLAQIFTLGSISGAIKVALDALSALIATNTSDITNLGTTKLDKNAATRTGLTAKAVVATDASGNEVLITGTLGQQIGFDVSNTPVAITPTVDINGLTQKSTPIGADEALISDSEASWINKKVLLKDMVMISEQTAQSAFTGDTDLFVVKQASGGLRKMTVADIRRAFINTGFNTTGAKLIATSNSSITTNTWVYSTSYATGSNAGGMISAFFRGYFGSSNYIDVSIQTSPDNSAWTDIWTDTFNAYDGYPATMGRAIALVFNAAYVRIGVRSQTSSWSGYQIHGSATINLTK